MSVGQAYIAGWSRAVIQEWLKWSIIEWVLETVQADRRAAIVAEVPEASQKELSQKSVEILYPGEFDPVAFIKEADEYLESLRYEPSGNTFTDIIGYMSPAGREAARSRYEEIQRAKREKPRTYRTGMKLLRA